MSEQAAIHPGNPAATEQRETLLRLYLLLALATALAGAALMDYRIVQQYEGLRTPCLVASMIAGIGLAFCLGGAMHYTNALLDPPSRMRPPWWARVLLVTQRRALMLLQLAATALVLAALAAMLFNLTIPGPDYSMLDRSGYTPPVAP